MTEHKKIIKRIIKETGISNLTEILINLKPADFRSLLLYVFSEISNKKSATDLLNTYKKCRKYLGISELNQKEIIYFDTLFYKVVPKKFDAVELSPIEPLGINAILTKISQKNILSTIHDCEVVSDPTIMLALETALRRKIMLEKNSKDNQSINLCTSKRLLRLQPFDNSMGYMQHFKCFAMCTATRDGGCYNFLATSGFEHISIYLNLIKVLNQNKFSINNIAVYISDIRIIEKLMTANVINGNKIISNTQNPNFKPFKKYGVNLPSLSKDLKEINPESISQYKIQSNIEFLSRLKQIILEPLQKKYPLVHFGFNLSRIAGINYYTGFCFHIYGTNDRGLTLQLADGGLNDWNQKLLNNKKENLITSGFGAELIHKMFKQTKVS